MAQVFSLVFSKVSSLLESELLKIHAFENMQSDSLIFNCLLIQVSLALEVVAQTLPSLAVQLI